MKKKLKNIISLFLGICLIYILILIFPIFLFSNQLNYRNYKVYSDKRIDKNIKVVLDDAIKRIQNSELYNSNSKFTLYLCNDNWRFILFSRNKNAGGIVNFIISDNIFIRKSNIITNEIIPPKKWVNSLSDRPLSYFIAHESIHALQRDYDKLLILKVSSPIIEGYADYISKQSTNDIKKLIKDFNNNSDNMNPKKGLYDRYNLFIAYLIEKKGYNFEKIIDSNPNIEKILEEIK